jgi:uncharacterized protein (TIGR00645 family)
MLTILDKVILASRWVLVVFFGGMMVALAVYAVGFLAKLWKFATSIGTMEDTDQLITLLILLDSALVGSLVVMVALSSYHSLVSRLTTEEEGSKGKTNWVALVDPGNLKIKLATALAAISSIHLLQIFMEIGNYDDRSVTWALIIHGAFLAGVICLAIVEKLTKK